MCMSFKKLGTKLVHLELSYTTQALLPQVQQMGKAAKEKNTLTKQPDFRERISNGKKVLPLPMQVACFHSFPSQPCKHY